MTTMTRLAALLLVATALIAGCVPARDNANDIANRPVAVLSVENGPYDDLSCGTSDSLDLKFSRGRCLHLSGRDSTDPQDDIVEYVFETRSDGEAAWTVLDVGTLTSGHTLVLDPTELRAFTATYQKSDGEVIATTHQARLTVIDANGGSSTTDAASFQLQNTLPVLLQPGNRYVPAFGALWKRSPNPMGGDPIIGGGLTVRVQSRGAVDEEGDELQYCWLASASAAHGLADACPAAPEDCQSTETFIEREIASTGQPDANGRAEYFLQACDGQLWSRPVRASIVIQAPPAWAIEKDFGRAVILDPAMRSETFPYPVVGDPGFIVDQDDRVRAFWGYDDPATVGKDRHLVRTQLVSSSAGSFVVTAALDADAVVRKVVPAPSAGVTWVVANVGSAGLGVYMIAGTSGLPSVDGPMMLEDVEDTGTIFAATDSATGDLWVSAAFAKHAIGFSPNGSIEEIERISVDDEVAAGDRMVTGIGIREDGGNGANQVWIGHAPHVLVPGADGPAGVIVYDDGAVVTETFVVAEDLVDLVEDYALSYGFGPYFNSPASFYVHYFGEGVAFYGILNGQIRLVDFTPTDVVGFVSSIHPASGELVVVSQGEQTILRVAPEGGASIIETSVPVTGAHAIQRETRVLTYLPETDTASARLLLGQGTGVEGVTQRFPIPPLFGNSIPGHDYSSGDLWVPTVIPIGAARYYADGRLADFIYGVDDPISTTALPFGAVKHVASDPADGALWLVAVRDTSGRANVVWRVDPYGPRPAPGEAASGGVDGVELSVDEDVLAVVAQPAVESTSAALVMLSRSDNGDGTIDYAIRRMLPDGSYSPTDPIPVVTADDELPQPVFIARDLVEPGVCVAVRNPLANQIIVRRYDPALTTFTQVAANTGAQAPRILATSAYDNDCWIAFRQGPTLVIGVVRPSTGHPPAFVPIGGDSEPASIVPVITANGIRPLSAHKVLVDFPEDDVIRRYQVLTTGMGIDERPIGILEDEAFRTEGDVRLLTP